MNYPREWMNDSSYFKPQDFEYRDFFIEMINLEIFQRSEPDSMDDRDIAEYGMSKEFWNDCLKRHRII